MDTAEEDAVVVVAAMAREFGGLRRYTGPWVDLRLPIEFACRTEVRGERWILAANGPGPRRARAAVEAVTARLKSRAAVSTGYCGALEPGLGPGDVIVATEVIDSTSGERFAAGRPRRAAPAAPDVLGRVVTGDRVIATAEGKSGLRARYQASAVDMEAAAVGAWAHARRVPCYCVRAVTDLAGEGFAIDFERARRADGSLPASRILWAALAKRSMGLRELARLGWRSRRASARLGEYLAGCQF